MLLLLTGRLLDRQNCQYHLYEQRKSAWAQVKCDTQQLASQQQQQQQHRCWRTNKLQTNRLIDENGGFVADKSSPSCVLVGCKTSDRFADLHESIRLFSLSLSLSLFLLFSFPSLSLLVALKLKGDFRAPFILCYSVQRRRQQQGCLFWCQLLVDYSAALGWAKFLG